MRGCSSPCATSHLSTQRSGLWGLHARADLSASNPYLYTNPRSTMQAHAPATPPPTPASSLTLPLPFPPLQAHVPATPTPTTPTPTRALPSKACIRSTPAATPRGPQAWHWACLQPLCLPPVPLCSRARGRHNSDLAQGHPRVSAFEHKLDCIEKYGTGRVLITCLL